MSQNSQKSFPVTWDQFHRDSRALAWRLQALGPFEALVAITRGGLVPAAIVARELNIRVVESVAVKSYDHQNQRKANILKRADMAGDGEGWLVIDDLVDTGNTFRIAREMMPKAHYACLYAKPAGVDTCDTYVMEVSQDTWIHFPWDLESQYAAPIASKKSQNA